MDNALQDVCRPEGICYGCGSSNSQGIQIKSYWNEEGTRVIASAFPYAEYTGLPGMVCNGYLAMVVDCHSNWSVMAYHYRAEGREPGSLPQINCVTGKLGIRYLEPAPIEARLDLSAWIEGDVGRKTRVICEVRSGERLVAVGDSLFVRTDTRKLAEQAHKRV